MATKKPIGRIIEVSFTKTIQAVKFEPDKVELRYALADGEDVEEAYDELRGMAYYLLNKDDKAK